MTPLPGAKGGKNLVAWRIDQAKYGASWDSGEGSYQVGGRWNSRGRRIVYCAIDPASAILEVAVHKGFKTLDQVPHLLTSMIVVEPMTVHVVALADIPDPNWLHPGVPSPSQQQFGDALMTSHQFIIIPSVVSTHSWNLIFDVNRVAGLYALLSQEAFSLDRRLHPPP